MQIQSAGRVLDARAHCDLLTPAKAAGWVGAHSCYSSDILCGVALLPLASQCIPVRCVMAEPGVELLLDAVAHACAVEFFAEQYVVMLGFDATAITAFQKRLAQISYRRLHVGSYADYCAWLARRLGPLGALPVTSPIRALLECFLSYGRGPGPRKSELTSMYLPNPKAAISKSFELGALGVQACESLLVHMRGRHHVENVEADPSWQGKDVDLLVRSLAAGCMQHQLRVEVKNENQKSKNLALEDISNTTMNSPGWLRYSAADVLVSILWPRGDMFFMDFKKVQKWVYGGQHSLQKVNGHAPGQSYKSEIFLAPPVVLMDTFDDVVYLNIEEWLPQAYGGAFTLPSFIPARLHSRKLSRAH